MKWFFALLILFGFGARADTCDQALTAHAQSAVTVLEKGFEKNIVKLEDLRVFAEGKEWSNPFADTDESLLRRTYLRAFEALEMHLDKASRAQVKAKIADFLKFKSGEAGEVEVAREETRTLMAPQMLAQLQTQGLREIKDHRSSEARLHGRPVLVVMRRRNGAAVKVLFDPFNPDSSKRQIEFAIGEEHFHKKSGQYFQVKGVDYLAFLDDGYIYNLDSLQAVKFPFTEELLDHSNDVKNRSVIYETPEGPAILAASPLKTLSLTHPEKGWRNLIADDPRDRHRVGHARASVSLVDGRPIGSAIVGENKLVAVDLLTGAKLPNVRTSETFFEGMDPAPVIFKSRGELYVLHLKRNYSNGMQFEVSSLRDGKGGKYIMLDYADDPARILELEGVAYLISVGGIDGNIGLIDPVDGVEKKFHASGLHSNLSFVRFYGKGLLIWCKDSDTFSMLNIESGEVTDYSVPRMGFYSQLKVFEYDGGIYAFAERPEGNPPALIAFTGRVK